GGLDQWSGVAFCAVQTVLRDVIEKRVELVVLLLGDGIKLVVVALSAADGEPHPHGSSRIDTVDNVGVVVLFGDGAALEVDHVIAIKAAGNLLLHAAAGKQVAGQLLDG